MQALRQGDWKILRYCGEARGEDVTIYTIRFRNGNQSILAEMANDQDYPSFKPDEPRGKYFSSDNPVTLKANFEEISKEIRAVITE